MYIVLIAVDSRPIADDWSFIPRAQQWGFGRYMGFYLGGSGRFSQFALTWLTGRLFGSTAVNIVPLAMLALTLGLGAWLLWGAAALANRQLSWPEAVCVSLLGLVTAFASAPGLYDTVGWFAAVVIYIAGPVAALAAVAWLVNWIRLDLPRPVLFAAVLALISAVAGGFDELVGATMALASLLAIYMVGDLFDGRARERVRGALAAITVGSVAGTVAMSSALVRRTERLPRDRM